MRDRARPRATRLLLQEAGGGILFGLVIGYATFRLLRSIDNYQVEVLLTLIRRGQRPPVVPVGASESDVR